MSRKQVVTILMVFGLAVGAWAILSLLPTKTTTAPPAHAQVTPSPPGIQILPKLPAAAAPPPEIQELERRAPFPPPQPGQPPRPTVQELLDALRALPGGPQAIEEAKRRGARISMKDNESTSSRFSWVIPLRPAEAEAQTAFSLTLTPANPAAPGGHWLSLNGGQYYSPATIRMSDYGISYWGFQVQNPYAQVFVNIPSDGWYIISFEAYSYATTAGLWHYPPATFPRVASWNYSSRPNGRYLYPALLELSAGAHYIYWVLESGTAYFRAAYVNSL